MLKISKRLQQIAAMVPQDCVMADIGSDHALLPCFLMQNNQCKYAYACDVNEGPLKHAVETITECSLENKVKPILTNGLHDVPEDAKVIVIAGMGFETIKMILENDINKVKNADLIIVQSNRDVVSLRKWISNHEFTIVNEDIVCEGHYYEIVSFTPKKGEQLNNEQCLFGTTLLKNKLFCELWQFRLNKLESILKGLDESHEKFSELYEEANLIKKYISLSKSM